MDIPVIPQLLESAKKETTGQMMLQCIVYHFVSIIFLVNVCNFVVEVKGVSAIWFLDVLAFGFSAFQPFDFSRCYYDLRRQHLLGFKILGLGILSASSTSAPIFRHLLASVCISTCLSTRSSQQSTGGLLDSEQVIILARSSRHVDSLSKVDWEGENEKFEREGRGDTRFRTLDLTHATFSLNH